MAELVSLPTDDEIIWAVGDDPSGRYTYVVKNWLRSVQPGIKTTAVRRRLQKLEKAGRVERVRPNFGGEILWRTR